jgi:hypothetical protein
MTEVVYVILMMLGAKKISSWLLESWLCQEMGDEPEIAVARSKEKGDELMRRGPRHVSNGTAADRSRKYNSKQDSGLLG